MQKRKHDWTAETRAYKDAEAFPWSLCFYTDAAFRCRALSRQFAPWPYLRRATIEWRNGVAFGAGIGEGARVISPRREIRRIGPNRSVSRPLRCPHDRGNPRTRANFAGSARERRTPQTRWRRGRDLNLRCHSFWRYSRVESGARKGMPGQAEYPVDTIRP
jgi:hypothetical protein